MECFETSMPSHSNATKHHVLLSKSNARRPLSLPRPFLLRNESRGFQQVQILPALVPNLLQAAGLGTETKIRAQPDLVRSYSRNWGKDKGDEAPGDLPAQHPTNAKGSRSELVLRTWEEMVS
jgi:hypothetical protein